MTCFARLFALFMIPALLTAQWVSSADAQALPEDDQRARQHFESGASYFSEGAYENALVEFEHAYRLSPRTAMLYNLGTTYERLGRFSDAADSFERYMREMGDELERRELLQQRIVNLRRRAASHQQTAASTTTPAASDDGGGLLIGGAVALGVAGVGVVLAGVFGGMALAEEQSVRDGCFTSGTCTPDAVSGMDSLALASDISWISAAVIGGVGVVLVVLGATAGDDPDPEQAQVHFTGAGVAGVF
ncbi:MAG TPA: tetratricopeptide repeat protein [Polyangiaceae bacterium]|nr:tetratricopeptide repeat protein [Polyangiaceae bacterium]